MLCPTRALCIISGPFSGQAIRYFLLFQYGGVYMDLDFACVRSLESIHTLRDTPGRATLILQRKNAGDYEAVSNAFMAAPPRHPFFRHVIRLLKASAHRPHVLDATGPRFLTRAYNAWVRAAASASGATNHSVSMRFEPWALLHRVHSCRPEGRPGPPCAGPYNFAPCKKGSEPELDRCARTMPNVSVTTFWTATWVKEGHPAALRARGANATAVALAAPA